MRRLSVIGGVLVIVVVGLALACGKEPVSKIPTSPGAPTVIGLQISGPSTVPPGQSVQFIADTRLSDGTVKSSVAPAVIRWRTSNAAAMQVSQSGLVTGGQNGGEATLTAEVLPTATIRATTQIVIVPDGTYRLVGSVRETDPPGFGIAGARVEVSGSSVAATTDVSGSYRLYGVPPSADIRVSATGYQTLTQNVQLTAHTTRTFLLPLSGSRLSLNGPFLVNVDVVGSCSGTPALAADLQHRAYEAKVTTSGASVDVQLTEPRFKIISGFGNGFSGRADPTSIRFTLNSGYYYFYYGYPNILELLANNNILLVYGTATATPSGGGVSGTMSGGVSHYDSRYPVFPYSTLGNCFSSNLRLTLTPR